MPVIDEVICICVRNMLVSSQRFVELSASPSGLHCTL